MGMTFAYITMMTEANQKKIFVAGHQGMVGRAICRRLNQLGFQNIITATKSELDLTNQSEVNQFFAHHQFDQVYLAAGKVGGVYANHTYPAEFIYQNLMIESNIIQAAHQNNVNQLLFLGSSCIYPRECPQPIREEYLLTGSLEPTNEPYAVAKIAGIKLCESVNREYGRDYRSVMPTNLYGPFDNFHEENAHVVPALIRRFHEAKIQNLPEVIIWGSGQVKREFLFVDDMAEACVFLMHLPFAVYQQKITPMCSHINLGTGIDCSISELASEIASLIGFEGQLVFDDKKPDGAPRKLLDVSKINSLGWKATTSLNTGLKQTYDWYLSNISDLRK
jgi:GDP-L-fucose synthase